MVFWPRLLISWVGGCKVDLAKRCWELGEDSFLNSTREAVDVKLRGLVNNATQRFEVLTGLHNVLSPVWRYWNAMFFAVTTYTTIGYGNITAKTRLGRLAAMVYAVIGIPLMLMILHKLGRSCLNVLDKFWDYCLRAFDFIFCTAYSYRQKNSDQDRITEMPLILAIGVAFGYMFFCAAIFLYFEEDWDYFKSFYFFFCSLTTIGYGDVTPTNSEDMFTIFFFILIGLSLVSMCINVIQLKLEKLFEEMLLMMVEEYSVDPDAGPMRGERLSMLDMWRLWRRRNERLQKEKKENRANLADPRRTGSILGIDLVAAVESRGFAGAKLPRGAPRGLIVPATLHSSQPQVQQQPSEVQRLIAELDARLRSARAILTPSPYTTSNDSFL
ncbi:unnamed protein product, partial [Mesorhabditis spiculigera]